MIDKSLSFDMLTNAVQEHSHCNKTNHTIGSQFSNRICLPAKNLPRDGDAVHNSYVALTTKTLNTIIQLLPTALRRFSVVFMSSCVATTLLTWFQPTKTPMFKLFTRKRKLSYIFILFTYVAFARAQDVDLASLSASQGFRILGALSGDQVGYSVNKAGDMNGDGVDDVVIGAPKADTTTGLNAGVAYVIFGRDTITGISPFSDIQLTSGNTALPNHVGFRIIGSATDVENGYSVSTAGDVNSDGVDDIIVGAPYADPNGNANAGAVYVIFGRKLSAPDAVPFGDIMLNTGVTPLSALIGFRVLGAAAGRLCGGAVGGGGDINGDGIDDFLIGATGSASIGATYVLFGRTSFAAADIQLPADNIVSPSIGFVILGAAGGDLNGYSVSMAGDINDDGICDIITGARNADPLNILDAGIVYVIFGRNLSAPGAVQFGMIQLTNGATALSPTTGFRILGAVASDCLGTSVSYAGDVNNDGIDDIIVSGNVADPPTLSNAGVSYVIYGRSVHNPSHKSFWRYPINHHSTVFHRWVSHSRRRQ